MAHNVVCDACKKENFVGYRYKCLLCKDYDLCSDCFERRRSSLHHQANHPMIFSSEVPNNLHMFTLFHVDPDASVGQLANTNFADVTCNVCHKRITKICIKCDDCHDYDLCWTCYRQRATNSTHKTSHALVGLLAPLYEDLQLTEAFYADNYTASGLYGTVHKVNYRGKQYALKTMEARYDADVSPETQQQCFLNEVRACYELRSDSIVRLYGHQTLHDGKSLKFYIMMEFMAGGTIKDVVDRQDEVAVSRKVQWMLQIARGLRLMHSKGYVHRDIKPDNLLLTEAHEQAKIGDLGISRFGNDPDSDPVYFDVPGSTAQQLDKRSDVLSYGLVLNALLTMTHYNYAALVTGTIDLNPKAHYLRPLIEACIHRDADKRPTAESVEIILENLLEGFWASLDEHGITKRQYLRMPVIDQDDLFSNYYGSLVLRLT